MKSRNYR